jgi:hypothetical protein
MKLLQLLRNISFLLILVLIYSCQKAEEEPNLSNDNCNVEYLEDSSIKLEYRYLNGRIDELLVFNKTWEANVSSTKFFYDAQGRIVKEIINYEDGKDNNDKMTTSIEYDGQGRVIKELYTEKELSGNIVGFYTNVEYDDQNLPVGRKVFYYPSDELWYETVHEFSNGNEVKMYLNWEGEIFLYKEQEFEDSNMMPLNVLAIHNLSFFGDYIFKSKDRPKKISYFDGTSYPINYEQDDHGKITKMKLGDSEISFGYQCN